MKISSYCHCYHETFSDMTDSPHTINPEFQISGFYALKGIAIICVIMVHAISFDPNDYNPFDASNGLFYVLRYIFNFGVPIFFVLSGYFLSFSLRGKRFDTDLLRKKINRILKPLLFWSFFYLIFPDITSLRNYGFLRTYYWRLVGFFDDISYFLSTFGTGHLWYLIATIYALFVIKMCNDEKRLYLNIIMVLCLLTSPFAHKFFHPYPKENLSFNPRAGFIFAIAYMIAGMNIERIRRKEFILAGAIFIIVVLLATQSWVDSFIVNTASNAIFQFLITVIICTFFFKISINNDNFIYKIGERSLGVYVIHIVFFKIFNMLFDAVNQYFWYFFVPSITLLLSYCFVCYVENNKVIHDFVR